MTTQPVRPERGKHNITYRNGTFRLSKHTVAAAGYPPRLEVIRNAKTGEVLLFPAAADNRKAFKLTAAGGTSWGNSFTSHTLTRLLGLPVKNETVYLFTIWDAKLGALHFQYKPSDETRNEVT